MKTTFILFLYLSGTNITFRVHRVNELEYSYQNCSLEPKLKRIILPKNTGCVNISRFETSNKSLFNFFLVWSSRVNETLVI